MAKEAEVSIIKMEAAAKYYNQQLLIKYGVIPFANLILAARQKEKYAVLLNRKLIQRAHFKAIRSLIAKQKSEEELIELFKSEDASKLRKLKLTRLCFVSLRAHMMEGK